MAELSNPRWERFCQELLADDNQTRAYIRAGYSAGGAGQSARRLMAEPEVAARVAELRTLRNERICKQAGVSQDTVVANLRELYGLTKDDKAWPYAIRVTELLGKHLSMWPTRPAAAGKAVTLDDILRKAYEADDEEEAP